MFQSTTCAARHLHEQTKKRNLGAVGTVIRKISRKTLKEKLDKIAGKWMVGMEEFQDLG